MTGLHELGVAETADAVRTRRVSAAEVAAALLDRIADSNPRLNAFTEVFGERALREARAVDAIVAAGDDPGPLAGVPYGVKNLFDVAGVVTRAGSLINRELAPARADATLVARMAAAGAVLLGAHNMDEYAYGFTTENAHDGNTRNPRDAARSAGGSSGGSACATVAGLGAFALASDTNGSIRVPASFCGLFGLKPTFGRLPRTGAYPFVFDLDHLGPLARSARDLALVYDALQGPDPRDAGCAQRAPEPVSPHLHDAPDRPRVAVLAGWFEDMAGDEAREAVAAAADALGATERVVLPGAEAARAAAFVITAAQGANLHFENLAARPQDFDPAVRDRLLAGALLPAHLVLQAQRVRRLFAEQAAEAFRRCDVLLAPSTPCPATLLGQQTFRLGGAELPARPSIGVLTQPLSCIGLPVVGAPIRRAGALPLGVQVVAAPWNERRALQVAALLEASGAAASEVAD